MTGILKEVGKKERSRISKLIAKDAEAPRVAGVREVVERLT